MQLKTTKLHALLSFTNNNVDQIITSITQGVMTLNCTPYVFLEPVVVLLRSHTVISKPHSNKQIII